MKSESKYKSFSSVSIFVITVYFLLNTILVIEWLNMQGTLSAFADVVFFIDLFTWHIYGIFAIVSFIVKAFMINKNKSKYSIANVILHFILMTVSFIEIYHMIQNAF